MIPKKFGKYGGGVLIAIKTQLVVQSNYIELRSKSEFLAVEFKLNDSTKIVITTCYRVGTLGYTNFNEISKSIRTLIRKRGKRICSSGWFQSPQNRLVGPIE